MDGWRTREEEGEKEEEREEESCLCRDWSGCLRWCGWGSRCCKVWCDNLVLDESSLKCCECAWLRSAIKGMMNDEKIMIHCLSFFCVFLARKWKLEGVYVMIASLFCFGSENLISLFLAIGNHCFWHGNSFLLFSIFKMKIKVKKVAESFFGILFPIQSFGWNHTSSRIREFTPIIIGRFAALILNTILDNQAEVSFF